MPINEDGTIYLLYVEDSILISKHWTGTSFSDHELVGDSVLEGSSAAYFITSTAKRIVCISSSFLLRSIVYDNDDEEWIDESIEPHKVHPKGKVAGSILEGGQQNVLFQDPSRQLVHLDSSWKPTILPVNAAEGTPITVYDDEVTTYVFYVSANDNCLHYVARAPGAEWKDEVFAARPFDEKEKPKHFLISQSYYGDFEALILTDDMALFQLSEDGRIRSLGTVNAAGEWAPCPMEECMAFTVDWGRRFRSVHQGQHHSRKHRKHC